MSLVDEINAKQQADFGNVGTEILNEVVKSYGFKFDAEGAHWSLENIGKAFQESPVFTTVDWLTIAVPVAKWGTAAAAVSKGVAATRLLEGAAIGGRVLGGAALGAGAGVEAGGDEHGAEFGAAGAVLGGVAGGVLGVRGLKDIPRWVGAAREAGAFKEGYTGSSLVGRKLKELGAGEFAEAARFAQDMAPKGKLGRAFTNFGARVLQPDELEIIKQYAPSTGPQAAWIDTVVTNSFENAKRAGQAFAAYKETKMLQGLQGLSEDQGNRFTRALAEGVTPESALKSMEGEGFSSPGILADLPVEAQEAYKQTWDYRNQLHDQFLHVGGINLETYARQHEKYAPQVYAQYQGILHPAEFTAAARTAGGANRLKRKSAEFAFQEGETLVSPAGKEYDRLLDPKTTVHELVNAAYKLEQIKFYQNLQASKVGKSALAVLDEAGWGEWKAAFDQADVAGKADLLRVQFPTMGRERIGQISRVLSQPVSTRAANVEQAEATLQQAFLDDAAEKQGLVQFDNLIPSKPAPFDEAQTAKLARRQPKLQELEAAVATARDRMFQEADQLGIDVRKVRGPSRDAWQDALTAKRDFVEKHIKTIARADQIPSKDPTTVFLDKAIAADLQGALAKPSDNPFLETYKSFMGYWRLSKTAYNPAGWVRNFLGNTMSNSFVNGLSKDSLTMVPISGIKSLASQDKWWEAAAQRGIIDSDFISNEIKEKLLSVSKDKHSVGMDWVKAVIGEDAGTAVSKGAGVAEDYYGKIDKVWRLHSFIKKSETMAKVFEQQGMAPAQALEAAMDSAHRDIFRFYPIFNNQSKFVSMARQAIPFSGFGAEAARFIKNAMIYKPHLVLWWNHMAEGLSHATAAMAGVSEDELQAAKAGLPGYTQGKKMVLMPWKDDQGQVRFLDLSYIIPLGDVENRQSQNAFFGAPVLEMFDPKNNPLVGTAMAYESGKDPFTGRDMKPSFTEQQIGVSVAPAARKGVSLGEYIARQLLPPAVPPGYAGTNIMESLRGTKSGSTGEPLEGGTTETVFKDILGMRTYKPSAESALGRSRIENQDKQAQISALWDRYEFAVANGNQDMALQTSRDIINLKGKDGAKYFRTNYQRHTPGAFRYAGKEELTEASKVPGEKSEGVTRRLREIHKGERVKRARRLHAIEED